MKISTVAGFTARMTVDEDFYGGRTGPLEKFYLFIFFFFQFLNLKKKIFFLNFFLIFFKINFLLIFYLIFYQFLINFLLIYYYFSIFWLFIYFVNSVLFYIPAPLSACSVRF